MKNLGISRLIHTFAADEEDDNNGCSRHDGYHERNSTAPEESCASVYPNGAVATTGGDYAGTACLRQSGVCERRGAILLGQAAATGLGTRGNGYCRCGMGKPREGVWSMGRSFRIGNQRA